MDCEKRCRNEAYHHSITTTPRVGLQRTAPGWRVQACLPRISRVRCGERWPAQPACGAWGLAPPRPITPSSAKACRLAVWSTFKNESISILNALSPIPAEHVRIRRAPQSRLEGPTAASATPRYRGGVAATPPERIHGPLDGCAGRLGQSRPVGSAISACDPRATAPVTSELPSGP